MEEENKEIKERKRIKVDIPDDEQQFSENIAYHPYMEGLKMKKITINKTEQRKEKSR